MQILKLCLFGCNYRPECCFPGKNFTEATGVTGLVLTKLDGTAKGGIIVSVKSELDIPVKFISVAKKLTIAAYHARILQIIIYIASRFALSQDSVKLP